MWREGSFGFLMKLKVFMVMKSNYIYSLIFLRGMQQQQQQRSKTNRLRFIQWIHT